MRKLILTTLTLSLLSLTAKAQSFKAADLDTLFNRLARHNKAMGSVLISKNGKTLYERGFGQAEVGNHANTPETVFRIGSITKTFTASLVFKLIEEGKLSLTDHLSKWYPQVRNADKITIDDLLTHHSGIHNFTQDNDFMEWQNQLRTKEEIVARIAGLGSDFEPGTKADYSNTNFMLLAFIVEDVTKKSYEENLKQRLTGPLKLNHTYVSKIINPAKGEALPYAVEEGVWVLDTPSSAVIAGGAGSIASTVGDLTKFIEALFLHHYLSDASFNKMKELRDEYGRGIVRFPFGPKWLYGHNGHIDNFSSMLAFSPDDSMAFSMVCNGVNYNFNDILIGVLSFYYNKPYKMPDFTKTVKVDAVALKKLEGVYSNAQVGMDITIKATSDGITAQATGQGAFPLEPVSATEFSNDGVGVNLSFEREGDKEADKFVLSQGGARIPFTRKVQ